MKALGVVAQKGGAGKTTICVHLAALALAKRSVVLVDTDPQRSAAGWWRRRTADDVALVEIEPGQIDAFLKDARRSNVDLVIVDSAPAHGEDVRKISSACDYLLVPSRPAVMDVEAIGPTVEIVAATGTPGAIVLNACPPGRDGKEASMTREVREVLAGAPLKVCPVSLCQRAAFSHALIDGRAVHEYDGDGRAASEMRYLWKWVSRAIGRTS